MTSLLDRTPSLTDTLLQAVLEHARTERLEPGDRLPSIKGLAERFGVSVPTMREAVQKLASIGAVEVRHGSGIYLTQARLPVITGHPGAARHDDATLIDLLDARLAIEPLLARRAAEHIAADQAASLRTALDEAERALASASGQHKANMNIHLRIAQAAGNPILADTIASLVKVYGAEQQRALAMSGPADKARNHADHVAIAEAVIARQPDAAEAAMRAHLARVLRDVRDKIATEGTPDG